MIFFCCTLFPLFLTPMKYHLSVIAGQQREKVQDIQPHESPIRVRETIKDTESVTQTTLRGKFKALC